MTKKTYIRPLTEIIEATYDEGLMKWNSTAFSDEPIEDDEFNAKKNNFFDDEELPNYSPWED